MFRKTCLVLAALATLAVVPQAHAAKGDIMLGLHGGVSMPMGDFKDGFKMGFLGGVEFDYMATEAVAIGADGAYITNKSSDDLNAALPAGTDAKFTMIQFGAHAKYFFPMEGSSAMPYLVGGAGMFNGKADFSPDLTIGGVAVPEDSETKFGGRIGVGCNFKAGESFRVKLEGNFNHVATEGSSTQFISVLGGVSIPMGGSK
jgi:outer membrane protein W